MKKLLKKVDWGRIIDCVSFVVRFLEVCALFVILSVIANYITYHLVWMK